MSNDDFYYVLKHVYDGHVIVHKFPGDIDITQLEEYLGDFLRACSWTDSQVEELFHGGEE